MALTGGYTGSVDKISVISCTAEMKQREQSKGGGEKGGGGGG